MIKATSKLMINTNIEIVKKDPEPIFPFSHNGSSPNGFPGGGSNGTLSHEDNEIHGGASFENILTPILIISLITTNFFKQMCLTGGSICNIWVVKYNS